MFASFLYFFLLYTRFLSTVYSYFCKGNICDMNCANCTYQCDPSQCLPSQNCKCASKSIPGGLLLNETPQFILYTLDDSFPGYLMTIINNLDFLLKDPLIRDSNNCSIRPSLYVNHIETDYYWLKYFEKNGGSINLHTLTHTTNLTLTTAAVWKDELEINFKATRELGRVDFINGSRAPYLQINDDYLNQIFNMGIKYDSSMIEDKDENNEFYWPFTLDNGVPNRTMCWTMGDCMNKPYPGLWEFPLTYWTNKTGGSYDLMYPEPNNNTLEDFKFDLNKTYYSNRAPRGFFQHPQYFTTNSDFINFDEPKANLMRDIYRHISTQPNVLFATENMIIEWMKNPLPFEETKNLPMFKCPNPFYQTPSEVCNISTCEYSDTSRIKICGPDIVCPLKQPELGGAAVWSKFKGNTNNFNLNTDYLIENNLNNTKNASHWLGIAKITQSSDWLTGMCGEISVINSNNKTALSQILIWKICKNVLDNSENLWGSDQRRISNSPSKWLKIENFNGNSYLPFNEFQSGGFCLNYLKGFNLNNDLRISVLFYKDSLNCTSINCKPTCGDDFCDVLNNENQYNCAVDCLPC